MTSVMSRLRPDETAPRPRTTANAAPSGIALLPIGADLLPAKTVTGRGGRGRRLTAVAVVVVAVVAVAGAYLLSLQARSSADADLVAAQDQQRSLQVQQKSFDEVVRTQTLDAQLRGALGTITADDTAWAPLLAGVAQAGAGIDVTSIATTLADDTAAGTAAGTTGGTDAAPTTPGAIGTLTLSGTAADKPTIATFVDALGGVTGLADPFLSNVTAATGTTAGYSFTVTVAVTGDLRSAAAGRWATTTGGGK